MAHDVEEVWLLEEREREREREREVQDIYLVFLTPVAFQVAPGHLIHSVYEMISVCENLYSGGRGEVRPR